MEILSDPSRIKVVSGGERAGKSKVGGWEGYGHHIADISIEDDATPTLYWLIGEDYEMCRGEFQYLVDFFTELDLVAKDGIHFPKQDQAILVTRMGGRFETKTAHDPRKLGVRAPNGVIGCEVGLWTNETWLRARGRVAEKRGWEYLSGSFENSYDMFFDMWTMGQSQNTHSIKSFSLPTNTNLAIYPGGANDPEILALKAFYPPDRFAERFEGIPSRPSGLVFKLASYSTHVAPLEWDKKKPIQLWIDPGSTHAYAVLAVQLYGQEVHVFDEIYVSRHTHSQVIDLCRKRPWWDSIEYVVMDRAGRQRNSNGESGEEVWKQEAMKRIHMNFVKVMDGIDRINTFLLPNPQTGKPGVIISPSCVGLLCELGLGPAPLEFKGMRGWSYPPQRGGHQTALVPIDEFNDACKALSYGLVDNFGYADDLRAPLGPLNYIKNAPPAVLMPEKPHQIGAWTKQRIPTRQNGLWRIPAVDRITNL